jgi:hypothetical protein
VPVPNRKMSIMAYGASGVGKSTQARYFSKYVWDTYQLRTRFICTDGGSLWESVADYVEAGFVDALLVPASPQYNPYAVMRKLGKGLWPKDSKINLPTEVKVGSRDQVQDQYGVVPWTTDNKVGLICTDSLTGYSSAYMYDAAVKNIRRGSRGWRRG